MHSALNACRAALGETAHLLQRRHGSVARKRSQQRAVCPAQLHGLFWSFARQKAENESSRESIAAANAVEDIQFTGGSDVRFPVDPGHRTPAMPVGRVYIPQSRSHNLNLWVLLHHAIDHSEKRAGIDLGFCCDLRTLNAQPFLQVLLIAQKDVYVIDN